MQFISLIALGLLFLVVFACPGSSTRLGTAFFGLIPAKFFRENRISLQQSYRLTKKSTKVNALGKKGNTSSCKLCGGKGAVNCIPCNGTGIDKKNGNIFERWTCNPCKGFGYVPCSCSTSRGLTPEQRGER
mmetsp:Transcript_27478/g.27697  ORF Transcript_27478/g.27697 Transcript_27478/m.27697 type:complete len:131 (-) Transcript_27478:100-492(-)